MAIGSSVLIFFNTESEAKIKGIFRNCEKKLKLIRQGIRVNAATTPNLSSIIVSHVTPVVDRSKSGTPGRRMNKMRTAPAIRPPTCAHHATCPPGVEAA